MTREPQWRDPTYLNECGHGKPSASILSARAKRIARMLLTGLLLSSNTNAAPYAYTLSGDQFVSMMNRPEPLSSVDYMEREKAYSYLDGARDSAEGRDWCDVNQLKTPDLAYELAALIAKQPASERKKNASGLILAHMKRLYPCRKVGGKS